MKKIFDIEKIEKYWMKNLTKILLYSWICIFFLYLIQQVFCVINKFTNIWYQPNILSLTELITITWAIFAFWYWYKKYERDKELEIIEKYTDKYNKINNDLFILKININENKKELERKYKDLFNLFYEEYYLKSKWYISDELWNEWSDWMEIDIYNFIVFSIEELFTLDDGDIFIAYLYWEYLQYYWEKNIKFEWKSFTDFLDDIFLKIKNDLKKELEIKKMWYGKEYYEKMKDITLWLEAIIETNQYHKNKLRP